MASTSAAEEVERLRLIIQEKDEEIMTLKRALAACNQEKQTLVQPTVQEPQVMNDDLSKEEIERYGRQLILPEVGVEGQKRLKRSSVLIIGAGGLGCPAAVYLAAAGVGHLGIVDYDNVEVSNLHRQILHTESSIGIPKAESLRQALLKLNSGIKVTPHCLQIEASNAQQLVRGYDLVIDCSDNPATRYLINDACVLNEKTLVSGSALRLEGQLTVYNWNNGPCYRCVYPVAPHPSFVTNCSDGGVLGVVPGLIGTLQALEALKIIIDLKPSLSERLLLLDAQTASFRCVKLRAKQAGCAVCSPQRSINDVADVDYAVFCGRLPNDKVERLRVLTAEDRVTVFEYEKIAKQVHLLIDVRPHLETLICSLPNSRNFPFHDLDDHAADLRDLIDQQLTSTGVTKLPVLVVCRRGNNSQLATTKLKMLLHDLPVVVKDIVGGLEAWAEHVDRHFPIY